MPMIPDSGTFQVAIVGSGPSGFYAAEALIRRLPSVQVDMFDRLPTPFGLVRGGVAPDHPKIKQVIAVYEKVAQSPRFQFIGNVSLGRDVTVQELRAAYHAVIIACGASADRRLGIPGESLIGSHTATEFVGWYNGHPDFRDRNFDLASETAVVIGNGNVAADVVRVLARPVDDFRRTDMSEHAIDALSRSKIKTIHVIGRRGPAQAKFTSPELKELLSVTDCSAHVEARDLLLNDESLTELEDPNGGEKQKNIDLLKSRAALRSEAARQIHFRFYEAPIEIKGVGRVESIILAKCRLEGAPFAQSAVPTTERIELRCGLIFRSVGYRGESLPGVAFDERSGTIPNVGGRCSSAGLPLPGLYVTGWIKRGPTGIIGTNRADSIETVDTLLADRNVLTSGQRPGLFAIDAILRTRNIQSINFAGWQTLDAAERKAGALKNKPREKFTVVADMLKLARVGDYIRNNFAE
jgi:ferredoxin/flavodoxin---NADP+ reductase